MTVELPIKDSFHLTGKGSLASSMSCERAHVLSVEHGPIANRLIYDYSVNCAYDGTGGATRTTLLDNYFVKC